MLCMRWINSDKYAMFFTPIKEVHVDMRAMAIDNKEPPFTVI